MKSTPLALVILFIGSALVAVTPNASASVYVSVWQSANLGPHISLRVYEEWYADGIETGGYFQWNTGDGAYGYLYGSEYISGIDGISSLSDGRPFIWTVIGSDTADDGTYGWWDVEISYDYLLPGTYEVDWYECCDYSYNGINGQLSIQSDPLNPWYTPPPLPVPTPGFQQNPDGTCTVYFPYYNDNDGDSLPDPDEWYEENTWFPCTAAPRVRNNADGSTTVYNDHDQDGQLDDGEDRVELPAGPDLNTQSNPDGSVTIYDDRNRNGQRDSGEDVATVPSLESVPVNVPGFGKDQGVPGQATPPVGSQTVNTPGVSSPATCTLSVCFTPTTLPGQGPIPISTPPVPIPKICIPTDSQCFLSVGPFTVPGQTVGSTPEVPSQTVPAICAVAVVVCLPSTPLVPPQSQSTPAQGPIGLTPPLSVSVSSTGFTGFVQPNLAGVTTVGPITGSIDVPGIGPVPYGICVTPCPVPVPPAGELHGTITVTLTVGAQPYTVTHSM